MAGPDALLDVESEDGSDAELRALTTLSDYGSDIGLEDIEDATLADVLGTVQNSTLAGKSPVLPSIEFEEREREDEEQHVVGFVRVHRPPVLRVAKSKRSADAVFARGAQIPPLGQREVLEIEYGAPSRKAWNVPHEEAASPSHSSSVQSAPGTASTNATRPPLERFRTKPRKPLSVTDLISPAWCELQYSYTLSTFGRKPRTQAMRTGSKIHQKLEDEVHDTVPVQVKSKEDRFGLRIWNIVSGLRCLRETGLTRELEVWGVLEGQVINGVIDELSYECPDPAFIKQAERPQAEQSGGTLPLLSGQLRITESFAKAPKSTTNETLGISRSEFDRPVYIADVKTRSVCSVPVGASLRPTWMQLMLYRKLLEALCHNSVDAETVFARYDLEPLEGFTDIFMREIESISLGIEVTNYPNLLSLWSLLVTEMKATFEPSGFSPVLRAEFRYAKTGDVIGSELIVYHHETINKYISDEMAWWKGKREARGVEIEEAFKCRICDFADRCSWRKTKVDETTEKNRIRRQAREKSTV